VKDSCGRGPDEPLAEGNCASASERGEEAGEQNLDSMNKNHVERHGMRDELAKDSEVRKGSKQSHVNGARVRGKIPHLIRGGLPEGGQKSAAAIVVGGVTTIQGGRGNSSTGRRAKRQGVEQKGAG